MTVRAVRNNNPGNLNAGAAWQGLMARADMTPEQAAEPRFAVFKSPIWGFRAMGVILLNYEKLHGLNTVRGYIGRWAPPGENNTDAYVKAVCHDCAVGADDHFDLKVQINLERLTKAIAIHEAGAWLFQDADLHAGVALAES